MKRFLVLLILTLILLTFVSCNSKPQYWEFEKDFSEVTEIKIVDIDATGDHYDYENYVIVKELDISIVEELYEDIESLEMKKYGTNLKSPRGKCFMIVFANGEFDLISFVEPKHFKYDSREKSETYGTIQANISWLRCDEEAFNKLIDKYLNNNTGDGSLCNTGDGSMC